MKLRPLYFFFLCFFITGIAAASVNYLWCSNSSVQLIEEEIGHEDVPLSKKSISFDEEYLSKWLSEFIACQVRFDHGVEIQSADLLPHEYAAHFPVEIPPPDRA